MKKLLVATAAALLFAGTARSAQAAPIQTLTLQQQQGHDDGLKELIEVEHRRHEPLNIIATDALYGGVAGLAVGAGVALINDDGNWGRDLAVGAGTGLLIGGLFGALDAAASSDKVHPAGVMSQAFTSGAHF